MILDLDQKNFLINLYYAWLSHKKYKMHSSPVTIAAYMQSCMSGNVQKVVK